MDLNMYARRLYYTNHTNIIRKAYRPETKYASPIYVREGEQFMLYPGILKCSKEGKLWHVFQLDIPSHSIEQTNRKNIIQSTKFLN